MPIAMFLSRDGHEFRKTGSTEHLVMKFVILLLEIRH